MSTSLDHIFFKIKNARAVRERSLRAEEFCTQAVLTAGASLQGTPEHLGAPALISWHLTGKCKYSILIHHSHMLTCIQGELQWMLLLFPYNFSCFFASQHHPTTCPTERSDFQAFYTRSFGFVSLRERQKGNSVCVCSRGTKPVFGGGQSCFYEAFLFLTAHHPPKPFCRFVKIPH